MYLDQGAHEERVRANEPALEAGRVPLNPLDCLSRRSFDMIPLRRTDRDVGESLRKLERDAHEWARDEESDRDIEEVEEAYGTLGHELDMSFGRVKRRTLRRR